VSTTLVPTPPRPSPRSIRREPIEHATAEQDCWLLGPLVAVIIAALGFLPIANWIPSGHAAPWYRDVASAWVSGTAIAVGAGIVLAILSNKLPLLWRRGLLAPVVEEFERRPWSVSGLVALVAAVGYVFVARRVLSGRPLLIDELVQVLQAQIYAGGSLWKPVAPHPEFFSSMHVVDTQGKVFSQFPAGGPAVLTIGVLLGAPWIVGPLCGAIAVLAFSSVARQAESRPSVALGAIVLFMSGSHMNHVPTLMWVLIAIACSARATTGKRPPLFMAFAGGLALGCAAATRPVDALAFALPLAIWYVVRAIEAPVRWQAAIAAGVGVALPTVLLAATNIETTGHPFLFGYTELWGEEHGLGFHRAPWGMVHTPARGLELLNLYFLRLQSYLFETPVPSLAPAVVALLLVRRTSSLDRYLLGSSALMCGLYWAYWHDGFYLGPRFVFLLTPVLALWSARALPEIERWIRQRMQGETGETAYRSVVYGALVSGAMAAAILVPSRGAQYRSGMLTMRWNADSAAARAGATGALVLVRESWGAQLVSRLWALGVPRTETEMLYRNVDACVLEQRITEIENSGGRRGVAWRKLQPLLADSARTRSSPLSPDTTEKVLPGSHYAKRCIERVEADRAGFTLLTPLLLAHGGDNVYARDLNERDTLLLDEYPGRPLWLLKPPTARVGEMPRFYPLDRDSAEQAWRSAR